ncbi:MAG: STAS domain-containing protein [Candidatus Poribacteria bacterium]|nr:STAS domain-containing protein [Candidatus Poribacteria bacterium]
MTTKIRQQNGITILEPNGKLMGPSVSELQTALSPQLETSDTPRILINFEHVNKIDSSGLGALMGVRAVTARKKGRIGVINVSKQIKNLVVLSRLVRVFEHYDSEAAAVSALSV